MKLLIDTDAFCKFGCSGLLSDVVECIADTKVSECGRLAALPHMLRKGQLQQAYGKSACDVLIPLADSMPLHPTPNQDWQDKLVSIDEMDFGEIQILAAAADTETIVLTGDKRALQALSKVSGATEVFGGRIAVLEAGLISLHDKIGPSELRRRAGHLSKVDSVTRICFSEGNHDPLDCLTSYFADICNKVEPLTLWPPERGYP